MTFNGTTATPTSWSATSIVVPVPAGATTGNVVVTVGGVASNALTFTVTTHGAEHDEPLADERTGGDVGDDRRRELRRDEGHEHGDVQRHDGDADELVGDEHRGAGAGRGDDGECRRHGRRRREQRVALHGDDGAAPSLTSLSPTSGPVGTSVTITGANFGATKGTSTVTFNGTTATPTSWSATSIVVPVPAGATTGNVVVTVGGVASNGSDVHVIGRRQRRSRSCSRTTRRRSQPTASVAVPFTAAQTAGNLNVVVVGWNDATRQRSSRSATRTATSTREPSVRRQCRDG